MCQTSRERIRNGECGLLLTNHNLRLPPFILRRAALGLIQWGLGLFGAQLKFEAEFVYGEYRHRFAV